MARPLRVEYPGALYHVMSRGNGRQAIYLDDRDRHGFLRWLTQAIEVHNLICHAYCLMGNHYHLLLETPDGNLSRAMRNLNGNYTQWFNARHHHIGHLLQGRYKAFLIEKETYLLEVARYIVLNPVRSGDIDHPREWRWSSYRATAGIQESPKWLWTDAVIEFFGRKKKQAQRSYRYFVEEGIRAEDLHEQMKHGFVLGSPQFVQWIWETQTHGSESIKEHSREQRIVGRPSLPELFDGVENNKERNATIVVARKRCGYLNSEIADFLGLHWTTIGKIASGKYHCEEKSHV